MKRKKDFKAFQHALLVQRIQDEKRRLFDDLDYDRISKAEYDKRISELNDELHNFKG